MGWTVNLLILHPIEVTVISLQQLLLQVLESLGLRELSVALRNDTSCLLSKVDQLMVLEGSYASSSGLLLVRVCEWSLALGQVRQVLPGRLLGEYLWGHAHDRLSDKVAYVLTALMFADIPHRTLLHELDNLLRMAELGICLLLLYAETVLILEDLLSIIDFVAPLIHQSSRLVQHRMLLAQSLLEILLFGLLHSLNLARIYLVLINGAIASLIIYVILTTVHI